MCWGNNGSQQCTPPTGLTGLIDIEAGGYHTIALRVDGTVVCWGAVGSENFGQSTVPSGLMDAVKISAGGLHSVVVVQPPCLADIDDSGFADAIDLAIVLANWGAPSPKYPAADVNGDGDVNGVDLAEVLSNWGACP